jgi:uncharacterized protein (TIGR02266 family)
MDANKRRHERKPLRVVFHSDDAEGAGKLTFEGSDLSTGGTFLLTDLLLEKDERLTLELKLPDEERSLKVQARVAWVRRFPKDGEAAGMGIEFLSMNPEERALLERYLSALA